ncbi:MULTISPECIES: ABC transporter ATP-binding protein [unclassified Devosia]|uniref:ABC transporter ATP-binding protein n=1 Tax=unclassified Devosia TaxID=196773 RepID=UPI00145EE4F5|nr:MULTISPECIES: ABC transporter ATP-binding protein [unclassified Devosia]MBJ6986789.1 ABC transporter ATP-binding protein [Devosia sp. MC521]QMW63824.1 ABC transporter ATP-binding protein [Devosia sp. MC521]
MHIAPSISEGAPAIELRDVTKRYPNGTLANEHVSLTIRAGEIHAICGENGAGKSTIMKMIYGLETPTSGQILINGQPARFTHPSQAIASGVGMVAQHLNLVPSLTIAENIVLGQEPRQSNGLLDRAAAEKAVADLASTYGLDVNPAAKVADCSIGTQQRVEILKTLYRGARIILMDEPTAVLTPQECDELFAAIQRLVASGVTVVIITHKLAEVKAISNRLTVLRDGKVTGAADTVDIDHKTIAEMMVGRPLSIPPVPRVDARDKTPLVVVRNLGHINNQGTIELSNVTLDVAPGEILGIAGVEGNGQDFLARVLSGLADPHSGTAEIGGDSFVGLGVRKAREMGMAAVPEDRLSDGVAATLSIDENLAATSYYHAPTSKFGWLNTSYIKQRGVELIKKFGVKTSSGKTPVAALSGGNMQKVVMARELSSQPRFFIAAQPTRGVDIGAAQGLRDEVIAARDRGCAVLLISADLEEVLALSDRIAVLFKGEITAHFRADTVDQREIGLYMTGLKRQPDASAQLSAPFATELQSTAS